MSWDDSVTTRSQNMAMRANQVRSQDDHSVEYYGRPQNQVSGPFGPRRGWGVNAGMDDSVLTDVRKCFTIRPLSVSSCHSFCQCHESPVGFSVNDSGHACYESLNGHDCIPRARSSLSYQLSFVSHLTSKIKRSMVLSLMFLGSWDSTTSPRPWKSDAFHGFERERGKRPCCFQSQSDKANKAYRAQTRSHLTLGVTRGTGKGGGGISLHKVTGCSRETHPPWLMLFF